MSGSIDVGQIVDAVAENLRGAIAGEVAKQLGSRDTERFYIGAGPTYVTVNPDGYVCLHNDDGRIQSLGPGIRFVRWLHEHV